MLERLKILSELPGISGREGAVRKYLMQEVKAMGLDPSVDAMGNVTVHKPGKGKRVLLCAHMDEKGLLAAGIREDGLLCYRNNGLDPRVLVSKRVQVGPDRLAGVIGAKANHLQSQAERESVLGHDQLFVDIGAKNKESAAHHVKVGDGIAFATKFGTLGEDTVKGKALEGRIGCAVLLDLLTEAYDCDLFIVFTTMAHIGQRGIQAAAWNVKPELVISIEGVEAEEAAAADGAARGVSLGEGPVLCDMDRNNIAPKKLLHGLQQAAGGKVQHGACKTGTDAGMAALALTGCYGVAAALPCRRIYTPCEMASISDIYGMREMLHAFLKERRYDEVNV